MDRFIKFFKSLKPNQIFMIVGAALMTLGGVGTVAGLTVTEGLELYVFGAGLLIFLLGGVMASMRAYIEGKKK